MNYNDLSIEEAIKLLKEQEKQISNQEKQISNQEKQISNQEKQISNQNKQISKQEKQIKKQENKIAKQKEKIEKLEAEKKVLNIELEKMIAKYEAKAELAKKMLADKYAPKTEKTSQIGKCINETESAPKEKKPRKTPTQNFIHELKKIATIVEEKDFDFEKEGVDRSKVKQMEDDVFYKLEVAPVKFIVKKIIRHKYKDSKRIYEPLVEDVFPHSPLTPSLAAHLITAKFELAVPIYRYAQYMKEGGFNINEDNLYNYVSRAAQLLKPIYDRMKEYLFSNNARVIHIDETPIKVIDTKKAKCYMFVYATSIWDSQVQIYDFRPTRAAKHVYEYLKDYDGYVVVDGYSGYSKLPKMQRCFAHIRRKFVDCVKTLKEEDRKKTKAFKVITLIDKLFEFERKYTEEKYTASQIKAARNGEKYKQAIEDLDSYILGIEDEKNIALNDAITYYINAREHAYTFLEHGYIDITNNLAERVVKPFTIGRKNFLFCKTEKGGSEAGMLYSIVQSARANGLKVEEYVKYAIENVGHKEVDDILPWSISLPKEVKIPKDLS